MGWPEPAGPDGRERGARELGRLTLRDAARHRETSQAPRSSALTELYIHVCLYLVRRTAADAALTREAITRAALHRFARDGWEGCSLVDVARDAGVTRGAVYHHFSGKPDLLTAVLAEQWELQARDLLAVLDAERPAAERPAAERLAAFLADYLRRLQEERPFRDLAVVSTLVAPRALPLQPGLSAKRDNMRPWTERIDRALGECEDVLRTPRHASRFTIMTFIHGAALTAAISPADLPGAEAGRRVAESVVNGLMRSR